MFTLTITSYTISRYVSNTSERSKIDTDFLTSYLIQVLSVSITHPKGFTQSDYYSYVFRQVNTYC